MTIEIEIARRYVVSTVNSYWQRGYFAEWLGYECRRDGRQPGLAGTDVDAYALVTAGAQVWPPAAHAPSWDAPTLVRATKFFHDHVSAPVEFVDHTALGCELHPRTFDKPAGQTDFRERANQMLAQLDPAVRIAENGSIESLLGDGLAAFLSQRPAGSVAAQYEPVIDAAIGKFTRASSAADQKDAVRDLADILEELRPGMRGVISNQDEADLFNIANNFAIRHRNPRQQGAYDPAVWMPWIFYWYLAAIHAVVAAIDRRPGAAQ